MVEFFLNEQSLTLFSRGNFTEISMISYVYIHTNSFIETVFSDEFLFDKTISDQTCYQSTSITAPLKTLLNFIRL